MAMTATYSPDDNKLRLYSTCRLDRETYNRVKDAGFKWAPKQELFVAPMWTPYREDLLIELCGEIDDEDTSLVDRAEQRAERFEDYSDRRAADADRAHAAVKSIADNIPFGQPILVGHHSERRARKDAERIENGMRKAVRMWDQSEYWTRRAAGALAHAEYKERPDVRARRIKTIEADKRKQERTRKDAEKWLATWSIEGLTQEAGRKIANYCHLGVIKREDGFYWYAYDVLQPDEDRYTHCPAWTVEQVVEVARRHYPAVIAYCDRWIAHYDNRLAYERAMLAEAGGTAADKWEIAVGGRVLVRGEWVTVLRINKSGGTINSLTTNRRFVSKIGIEEVKDYQPPTDEQAAAVKKATEKAPICNYPAESIGIVNRYYGTTDSIGETLSMTKAEWKAINSDYKTTRNVPETETTERHRVRVAIRGGKLRAVFISDEKRKDPPLKKAGEPSEKPIVPPPVRAERPHIPRQVATDTTPGHIEEMRQSLKAGIQTVSAPQLFPTPPEIAAKMVELAEVAPGMTVLEPSAGTGNIITKIQRAEPDADIMAVEIKPQLCQMIANRDIDNLEADFLNCSIQTLGTYDRILMNPPFINGEDIKHINHAVKFLNPGGRLVALCSNGPRQQAAFQGVADHWEVLPAGSFKEQGTGVNVALVVLSAE